MEEGDRIPALVAVRAADVPPGAQTFVVQIPLDDLHDIVTKARAAGEESN